jgi:hypothetical protein
MKGVVGKGVLKLKHGILIDWWFLTGGVGK